MKIRNFGSGAFLVLRNSGVNIINIATRTKQIICSCNSNPYYGIEVENEIESSLRVITSDFDKIEKQRQLIYVRVMRAEVQ